MTHYKSTIADQLGAAGLAIHNSQNDAEIGALVAAFGYNTAKLNEGQALLEAARAAVSAQENAVGAQIQAGESLAAAKTQAVDAYQSLAKVARAVCTPGQRSRLGLDGSMPLAATSFLTAAATLFDNAPMVEPLAGYGYNAEKLCAERARIEAYNTANQLQEAAKGAAQQSTREQNAALADLNQWTAQYIKIARVALREKPELLEKLGVPARSAPPRKAAPKDDGQPAT